MSKLKPALVFVVALTLFVWFWLQLMSLYGATYSAALSLLKPVRRRDDPDLLATKPTPYGALVRVMKCREANICLCKFWSWHPTFRQPSGNQPRYLRQRQAR